MAQQQPMVRMVAVVLIVAMAATGLWVGFSGISASQRPVALPSVAPAAATSSLVQPTAAPAVTQRVAPVSRGHVDRVRIDIPADLGPPGTPVVLGLHGRGDNARDFAGLAARLLPSGDVRLAWRGLEGPVAYGPGAAWFVGDRARPVGLDEAAQAVADEVRALARDGRRVTLFGFSQGCMTLAHVALLTPDLLDAAVCIGGAVVGNLPKLAPFTGAGERRLPTVLVVAGVDDQVVPVASQREMAQALESRGLATERIEHSGGHSIPADAIAAIKAWLWPKVGIREVAVPPTAG